MEDEAEKLMTENLSKNFIDFEEYPQTAEISVSDKLNVFPSF
jgi:glutamate decarboxylase